MTTPHARTVLVLGAGPAGLTAAYRFAQRGLRVTVLDQGSLPGGSLLHEPCSPPLVLGCHRATWNLLRTLGTLQEGGWWQDTSLLFQLTDGRLVRYPRSRFPTPLHVLFTLSRFAGLPWKERWRLLAWLESVWEGSTPLATDLEHRTGQDWLTSVGQSDQALRSVWNPLARWLTGNDLRTLSADAFVASVRPFLLQRAADSRVATSEQSWQTLFLAPILDALSRLDVSILRDTAVVQLLFEGDRVTGVRTRGGAAMEAGWYVSALPHDQLAAILPERWLSRFAYFQQLQELTAEPCTVVEVTARRPLSAPLLLLLATHPFQRIQACGSAGGMSRFSLVRNPGAGSEEASPRGAPDLLQSLGLIESPDQVAAVRTGTYARAFLSLAPGTGVRRPIQRSPIANLLLAGAWTDTGWSVNLESAIVSGERCAELIPADAGTPH